MAEASGTKIGMWQEMRRYFDDVRTEMKRVTWPGKQEIYSTTIMVILTTFLFGFYFFLCDEVFVRLVSRILAWGKTL